MNTQEQEIQEMEVLKQQPIQKETVLDNEVETKNTEFIQHEKSIKTFRVHACNIISFRLDGLNLVVEYKE